MISHNIIQRGRILRIAAGITMLALLLAGSAGASTLTVNASGGANYTRIQDAIDNASDGDTILVYSGIYYENVNVNRQLILRGIGMPVVDALGNGSAIMLAADGIILEGFTATGAGLTAYDSPNAGIRVASNNNTLIGNNASNINENACGWELCESYGISLEYSTNNTLIGNNANWNGGYYSGYGIFLSSSNNNTLINNNANWNGGYWGNGIILTSSNNNTLINNNASSNKYGGIILSFNPLGGDMSRDNTLIGNRATYNYKGIYVDSFYSPQGNTYIFEVYNILNNNTVSNNGYGLYLRSRKNTLTGNNASNNTISGIHIDTYNTRGFDVDNGENTLNNNTVSNNGNGIYLRSKSNILTGNNASNNTDSGIYIETYSSMIASAGNGDNTLNFNSISNNGHGVSIDFSRNNTVMGNNILNNDNGIILLNYSDGNLIYNNNFSNMNNANDSGNNTWNTTKTSGTNIVGGPYLAGNFWANPGGTGFSQMCSDVNGDGICDEPYVLDGNNIDHLPLSMNFTIDTISPANITNLTNITYAPIYINFTWTNPPDPDYHHVMLFLNGSYKTSVTAPQNHYNFTGLDPDTLYELGTHTVDNSGNVNEKWVNATGRTAPSGLTTIQITNPSANPAIILNDNGRARPPGTNITRLNVTVTGNVSSVIIDLSPLGGLAKSPMTRISGTDIYSITTNATAGINLTNDLVVNATDTIGNFNNSVGIPVTVLLRGDIVRDNKIDLKDLLYMRRHLAGLEPSINTFVADIQQAEGDGNVDLKDLLYMRKYLAGLETLI